VQDHQFRKETDMLHYAEVFFDPARAAVLSGLFRRA
jgi:hypothetical protein